MSSTRKTEPRFQFWRWLAHVLVLWSFAVAQPLYAKLAENLPFLLAHRIDGGEVVFYALILLLPVPLALTAIVWLSFLLSSWLGWLVRTATVLILAFFAVFPLLTNVLGLPEWISLLLAAAFALLPSLAYDSGFWKGLLDVLIPAPLLFVAFFLFFSPVRVLLFDEAPAADGEGLDRLNTPVVMILLDEFPTSTMLDEHGELDRERLPGFARLADISTWYPQATTVVEATVMAAPVFLSGVMPVEEHRQPPVYQHFPENIFDQVSPDRRIWAIENGSRLCRPGRCEFPDLTAVPGAAPSPVGVWQRYRDIVLDSGVIWGHMSMPSAARRHYLPELGAQWMGFIDGAAEPEALTEPDAEEGPQAIRWNQRMLEFEGFMESLDFLGPDTLHYLHALLPHAPWVHLPDGRVYDLGRSDSIYGMVPDHANQTDVKHLWYDDEWATVIGEQRYHLQLQFVDRLIDRLVDRLEASDHFDELILIVAADHGAGFTPGTSRRALTEQNFAEILPIPLFVRFPGQTQGRVDSLPAELLDVTPTIRHVLGLGTRGLDGQSLRQERDDDSIPRLVNEHGKYFEFERDRFDSSFQEILERMHTRIDWDERSGFPRLAEYASWYWRPVEELGHRGIPASEQLHVSGAGQWQNIDLKSRFLPSRLVGRLPEADHDDQIFVAAINDRVAGFGRPYSFPGGEDVLEILMDYDLFVDGHNDVAVYQLEGSVGQATLIPVFASDERIHLIGDDLDQLTIMRNEQPWLRVASAPPWGQAHLVFDSDQNIFEIRGWAGDPITGRPASRVHVFVGDERIVSVGVEERRADLVERFGHQALEAAGFRAALPLAVDPDESYGIVRVIAVDAEENAARLSVFGIEGQDLPFVADANFSPDPVPDPLAMAMTEGLYPLGHWIKPIELQELEQPGVQLLGDWYRGSQGIRWTGRNFSVCLQLGPGEARFRLEAEVIPLVHDPEVPVQNVQVSVEGKEVGQWRLDQRATHVLSADFEFLPEPDNPLCLAFSSPDAVAPASLNIGEDSRTLGLAFLRLRVLKIEY